MTIEEMKKSTKEMLTAKDVSEVLGIHSMYITDLARQDKLPFPFIMSGNRTKIPRMAFLKWGGWVDGEKNEEG